MLDLTFGEQVKIILSRKGMTIKELAEMIEERTGKKMSRQNLTQRLGRDNFQEQDMRMIAEILDCPFQLNILGEARQPENTEEESVSVTEAELLRLEKKKGKKHRHPVERDITIGELVDLNRGLDQLMEEKEEFMGDESRLEAAEAEAEEPAMLKETVPEEAIPEETVPEDVEVESVEPEEVAAESVAPEDAVPEGIAAEEIAEETIEENVEEMPAEEAAQADVTQAQEAEPEAQEQKGPASEAQERPAKKARGSWRDFFQRRSRKEPKESAAQAEAEETLEERAAETPVYPQETREEMLRDGGDEEEDLERGEVNPYTGHEYESNTVRMHPKRIGYVQVYDRSSHQWTDMTEWAFLGYQERKKALLGNDYEPPIYLD